MTVAKGSSGLDDILSLAGEVAKVRIWIKMKSEEHKQTKSRKLRGPIHVISRQVISRQVISRQLLGTM